MMIGMGMPSIQSRIERPIGSSLRDSAAQRTAGNEGCAVSGNRDDDVSLEIALPELRSLSRLDGRTILIVENDPAIGLDLRAALIAAGAKTVGPANSVEGAFALIADHALDAAILDIRLQRDELVFPVADTLQALRVPYVFASGRSTALMPLRHGDRPFFDKPFQSQELVEALAGMLKDQRTS
jgi:CheY-like chemotaxis protein